MISAVIGTTLGGLLSNPPLAQAYGMLLNAFFVYTACIGFGHSYANALVLVLIEGVAFILLTVTDLRKKLFDGLPQTVRGAIPAGIGLFIALLSLKNSGIVVPDSSTCVNLASFNLLKQSWGDIMPMLITVCTLLAIVIMAQKNIRGSVFVGIIGGIALYYLLGLTVPGFYENLDLNLISPIEAFKDFSEQSLFKVFSSSSQCSSALSHSLFPDALPRRR